MKKAPQFSFHFISNDTLDLCYLFKFILALKIPSFEGLSGYDLNKVLSRFFKGNKMIFICLLMIFYNNGSAQFFHSFSPIAYSKNGLTATGGNAIIINGKSKCLIVASGISSLNIANNGNGVFSTVCKEVSPIANFAASAVSMILFPNPVISEAKIMFTGQVDADLSCQIRVMNIEGKIFLNKLVLMKEVQVGYMFQAGLYPAGTYLVTVEFMNKLYTMKLIKL